MVFSAAGCLTAAEPGDGVISNLKPKVFPSHGFKQSNAPLSWSAACLVSAPEVGCLHRESMDRPDLSCPYPKPLCPAWFLSLGFFCPPEQVEGSVRPHSPPGPSGGRVLGGHGQGMEDLLTEVAAEVRAD